MKNFQALELLRLVTFLPLLIVILAMMSQDQYSPFKQPEQIVSKEQPAQVIYFW